MGVDEARHACTTVELDTLHATARAYLDALSAKADLEVLQVRLETAARFRRDIQARREVQMATELDRLRAESEFLKVSAENLKAESAFKRAVETLNGHLGLDPRTPLALAGLGPAPETLGEGPAPRSEINQLREQEAIYRKSGDLLRAELRPKLDFTASYGYQSPDSGALFRQPYDTWRVNVRLRIPVFDGMRTSGRMAQNRAQLEQTLQVRVDKERAFAVERATAEREFQTALAYRTSARLAYSAAAEALRTSRESFAQGIITSLDLLQAEREERLQESARQSAQLGVWRAMFGLRRAYGLPPI